MSAKRHVDTSHPDCAEYTRKFHEIWNYYFETEAKEKAKYPDWEGKDHPAYEVLRPLHRECCEKTKRLQEQYAYLFIEE